MSFDPSDIRFTKREEKYYQGDSRRTNFEINPAEMMKAFGSFYYSMFDMFVKNYGGDPRFQALMTLGPKEIEFKQAVTLAMIQMMKELTQQMMQQYMLTYDRCLEDFNVNGFFVSQAEKERRHAKAKEQARDIYRDLEAMATQTLMNANLQIKMLNQQHIDQLVALAYDLNTGRLDLKAFMDSLHR